MSKLIISYCTDDVQNLLSPIGDSGGLDELVEALNSDGIVRAMLFDQLDMTPFDILSEYDSMMIVANKIKDYHVWVVWPYEETYTDGEWWLILLGDIVQLTTTIKAYRVLNA